MTDIRMRPSTILLFTLATLALFNVGLSLDADRLRHRSLAGRHLLEIATSGLGLSDLCIATEARYTRHPAASDRLVPFMDYPGAMEHFPTGSFWAPPPHLR